MRKKIWALESGHYSDREVHCLFTNKADADKAALTEDPYGGGGYNVVSYDVFDVMPEPMTQYSMVEVISDANPSYINTTVVTEETKYPWMFWDSVPRGARARYVRAPMYGDTAGRLEVKGDDKQAVQQVFSDNRAVILDALSKDEKPREVRP